MYNVTVQRIPDRKSRVAEGMVSKMSPGCGQRWCKGLRCGYAECEAQRANSGGGFLENGK